MQKTRFLNSYSFLLIFCIMIIATGCPKPKPEEPKLEELLSKEWRVKEVLVNGVKDQTTDYSSYRRNFKTDGIYIFTDAPGVVAQGKWKLVSNNQRLLLDESTAKEQTVVIVSQIKEDQLDLEFTAPGNYKTGEQKVLYRLIR